MNEGDVFNTEALKMSIKRVNQLGYFKAMESAPDIQPSPDAENKVDVTFKVQEQNRNQFTFGGGVSGYEGAFLNASFSTTNFLGAGETVSLAVQTGNRTKNYSLSISEPYFLDRPITAGFNVFLNRITYLSYANTIGYGQQTPGISVTTGLSAGHFSHVFTSYSYQIIDIYNVDQAALTALENAAAPSGTTLPMFDPSYLGGIGRASKAALAPPTSGAPSTTPTSRARGRVTPPASSSRAGRSGERSTTCGRPWRASSTSQSAAAWRLGVRGQVGLIRPFGDTTTIPYYQRYFLGGETQIRGYNVRTVARTTPRPRPRLGRQVPTVQRRVLLRRVRAVATAAVFRRRPGFCPRPELLLEDAEHLHRGRSAFHDARAQRAVPTHLRVEPQPRLLSAAPRVQVRGGDDILNFEEKTA